MKRNRMTHWLLALLLLIAAGSIVGQQTSPDAGALDEVDGQAAQLEGQLGKVLDTTPEAAEAMLKLIDLYGQHGRVFGLIRHAQTFVSAHPGHARHREVMLKLIDGLVATTRHVQIVAVSRQFIERYGDDAAAPGVALTLARTLERMGERDEAARAYEQVWRRMGEAGRDHAVRAMELYESRNDHEGFAAAAKLASEVLEKLPAGTFAAEVGWAGFHDYRRHSDWAGANAIGLKIVRKNLPLSAQRLAQLHYWMAEHDGYQSQHRNAANAARESLKLHDDPDAHRLLIHALHAAEAKAGEIEPVVNAYAERYPNRDDRWSLQALAAVAHQRDGQTPRALELAAGIMPHDARSHDLAQRFVEWCGEDHARAERALLDVLNANKDDAAYVRYVLAFSVYRERMKDAGKARQAALAMLEDRPADEGFMWSAVGWLLGEGAGDEAAFRDHFTKLLASVRRHMHVASFRAIPSQWVRDARNNKDLRERAEWAKQQIEQLNADPLFSAWVTTDGDSSPRRREARDRLCEDDYFNRLNDEQARMLLARQISSYANRDEQQRKQTPRFARMWAGRFPKDGEAARRWLQAATDYGTAEEKGQAVRHMLTLEPREHDGDAWRRVMGAALELKDEALLKQAYAWVLKAQQAAPSVVSAGEIGEVLDKAQMKDEAMAYWRARASLDADSYHAHYAASAVVQRLEGEAKIAFVTPLLQPVGDYHGAYASWLADAHLAAGRVDEFEHVLREARKRQNERPFRAWHMGEYPAAQWLESIRREDSKLDASQKRRVYEVVRDMELGRVSAVAQLMLLGTPDVAASMTPMRRLLAYQDVTMQVGRGPYDFDWLMPHAQSLLAAKDYAAVATLATAMLTNIPEIDSKRQQAARDMIGQAYARMGGVGLAVDESSPLAPLMKAALYLRLGDRRLALDAYDANRALFDQHRTELPVDLILFVAETHMAAGGEANHERVEDMLRAWLLKYSESANIEASVKAQVQLLLARNYDKAGRFEVARSEYATVINRYGDTPQAVDAQFGIGEAFMSQKIYDQAEQVFERLAESTQRDVVVRAQFMRGVLAYRRGDRDEARRIFVDVLQRVPDIQLADRALYNLAEVYGDEQRHMDQLELLRTVGRLGRESKRWHTPGEPLSIVVQDSDLGISRGHAKIPVLIRTEPGGDEETGYLLSGGAGKGLFRVDLETRLGQVTRHDKVLQLTGRDVIRVDYPEQFKQQFRSVPLSDAEMRIAADAKFQASSSKIVDEQAETFSQRLEREAAQRRQRDERRSEGRPADQIKPGNAVYLRVTDLDRDLSDEADRVIVKLAASSGDQVQLAMMETGPHTGVFEASATTGELPAGALASDFAIDRNPLMAIDHDRGSSWQSQPDGATPKWLSVDMKDLKRVSRVSVTTPDAANQAPVRMRLQGSHDGRFWYTLARYPMSRPEPALADPLGRMTMRVYPAQGQRIESWRHVVELAKRQQPTATDDKPTKLQWSLDEQAEGARRAHAVIWHGRFVQPRDGAVRFEVTGTMTALMLNGVLELPLRGGQGAAAERTVDVYLPRGLHDLTIFSLTNNAVQGVSARLAREDMNSEQVRLTDFRAADFDLDTPQAQSLANLPADPATQTDAAAKPLNLSVKDAQLTKKTEQFGLVPNADPPTIGYWQSPDDAVAWQFDAPAPGVYSVWITSAYQGAGSRLELTFDDQKFAADVPDTGDWRKFTTELVGVIRIDRPGRHMLSIKPLKIENGGLMDLRQVTLEPARGSSAIAVNGTWDFAFKPAELRHVRVMIDEYLGEAVAINHLEVAGDSGDEPIIPTKADVLALAGNDVLEIAAGDEVEISYIDEFTAGGLQRNRLLTQRLTATYFNAQTEAIAYDFVRQPNGQIQQVRKELMRIDPGERVTIEVTDYDMDTTAGRDTVKVQVQLNEAGGEGPIVLSAIETDEYSGVFRTEVDTQGVAPPGGASPSTGTTKPSQTAPDATAPKLAVKPGDRIYLRYLDQQNTFPGHAVPRESVVYVNQPSEGRIRVVETRHVRPSAESPGGPEAAGQTVYLPPRTDAPADRLAGVAYEAPFTVEVIDPDAAKDSGSFVTVRLTTTDGAEVDVRCVVSGAFAPQEALPGDMTRERWALHEGRFIGQVVMQLGGKNSPAVVPSTADLPRDLIGGPVPPQAADADPSAPAEQFDPTSVRVLNLSGNDRVTAAYADQQRPSGEPIDHAASARLIANGILAVTDRDYDKPVRLLHVGEKVFLRVADPDRDVSAERDRLAVRVTSNRGEEETLELEETLSHSGLFTGSFPLKAREKPTPTNASPESLEIECFFGDALRVEYLDPTASTESSELLLTLDIPIAIGTDGLVAAFSKTFANEELAVQTQFHIAESYFELFKSHLKLAREQEMTADLEAGRRVLREVMEDYPDPKYAPRVAYLLGQFAQELKQWDEAIDAYQTIVRQYADHTLAADAQYKLAQCYEEAGRFDQALEAYVTLAATYPKSPLIANVMIRINEYFYQDKNYLVAAQVGVKFLERFESHQWASRMAFRIGQCYYKAEQYAQAAAAFDDFAKRFPDDELCADALFWAGESYRTANDTPQAFRRYNRCRWDYPESEAAKYARGRLALPEMLQQFEREAESVDEDQ